MLNFTGGYQNTDIKQITIHGINGQVAGTNVLTTIPTPPSGRAFLIFFALTAIEANPGAITTAPTGSLGTNATTFDNLVAAVSLTNLIIQKTVDLTLKIQKPVLLPGNQVIFNISVPAVSVSPFTIGILLLGIWI